MCVWIVLVGLLLPQQDAMRDLADQGRWDEIIRQAEDRLGGGRSDHEARYWLGRASVERARVLLQGRAFSRDLARAILHRAIGQLMLVPDDAAGAMSDAKEWRAYARFLSEDDAILAKELEQWFEEDGCGYAAYLRGLIAVAEDEPSAVQWLERAARRSPERPMFALEWSDALARAGRRSESLDAWDLARDNGADQALLLGQLLSLLPAVSDAGARLAKLDTLLNHPGARVDGQLAWYRAFSLEQIGLLAEAEQVMAAATDNRTWDVDRAHARLLARLGRRTEAGPLFAQAATEGDQLSLNGLIDLGNAAAGERLWEEGLQYYDIALGLEPRLQHAALNRALLLAQSGRSLDAYRSMVGRSGGRADILNDAALAAWGWGRLEEAENWFATAAELPGALDATENLAALLMSAGPVDGPRIDDMLGSVLSEEPTRARSLFLHHMARQFTTR
jgi:tetratricopeptide (TPR) repeat protein